MGTKNKASNMLIVSFFLLAIYLLLVVGIAENDKLVSEVEKRTLAQPPSAPDSVQALATYPQRLNDYYADHFGFRELFTKTYFRLINRFSPETRFDDVTVGKDGWLFLGSIKPGYRGYDDPIGDAIHVNLFTEQELERFASTIVALRDWLDAKGVKYVYVIAPSKHTVYFEKLPDYISKHQDRSSTDQLVSYLAEHTNVEVVDLRPVLMEAKTEHQLFFKTDSHWNHYGANVAQYAIMRRIQRFFPGRVAPFLLSQQQFEIVPVGGGDLAGLSRLEGVIEDSPQPRFGSRCTPEKTASVADARKPHTLICEGQDLNALIFRDSYFITLQPYVSRQFYRSTYIWEKINYHSLQQYIDEESPDIVIDQVVERSYPYDLAVSIQSIVSTNTFFPTSNESP